MNRTRLSLIVTIALGASSTFGGEQAVKKEPGGTTSSLRPVAAWRQDWSFQNTDGTYAVRKDALIRVGNASLERVFRFMDGSR